MVVASLVVPLLGANEVELVRDVATIPSSLPWPVLPSPAAVPGLIIPALALTFVGLMQGAGISQSTPNPDGRYPDASGDFVGQGVANIVSGLFQGTVVAGSLSATALVIGAGARSRAANIFAGLVMAVAILLFGRYVGAMAMPALAGLLIVVGFRTLKPARIGLVWRTGAVQQAVMALTFLASLLIPLQYAVLLGVALAVVLYVFQQSNKITVKAWQISPGQYPVEIEPPPAVPAREVTILMPYGSLFYAAAPVFSAQLPEVTAATRQSVVILVLRGQTEVGSTFLNVLTRYGEQLGQQESNLMLAGVEPYIMMQMKRTGILRAIGRANVFPASEGVGEALLQAVEAAEEWIAAQPGRGVD
jgi:SulP family sulfate permease